MTAVHRSVQLVLMLALCLGTSGAWAEAQVGPSGTWTSFPGSPAGPRTEFGAIFDAQNERMVVFGGAETLADPWLVDLQATTPVWTRITTLGPSGRKDMAAAYDPLRRRAIFFGGYSTAYLNDVWTLSLDGPPAWSQLSPSGTAPSGRMLTSMVYDPVRDRMITFGGHPDYLNDTWALNLSGAPSWAQVSPVGPPPPARWGHSLIYDPVGDRVIVFGGIGLSGNLNDVWALNLATTPTWVQLSPSGTAPNARRGMSSVYDPTVPRMLMFGGISAFGSQNDLWELSLSGATEWSQLAPVSGPPAGRGHAGAILQPARARIILYGGRVNMTPVADVWGLSWPPPTGTTQIWSFTPTGGSVGTPVVILGAHLSGATQVTFGGTPATIASNSESQINTTVPPGAVTGPIVVTAPEGSATSATSFVVGEAPRVDAAVPDTGRVGDTIAIRGQYFAGVTAVSFADGSVAEFVVQSDSVITAVIGPAATSGPIRVVGPTGTGQSAFAFQVLPPRTRPLMIGVRDIANDQGGRVDIRWLASSLDNALHQATAYRIWRRAPLAMPQEASRMGPRTWPSPTGATADPWFWEQVGEVSAAGLTGYAFTASTPQDSMQGSNPYTAFAVQALTANPAVYYFSGVDSGYSVDDLAPTQPQVFAAVYARSHVELHWLKSPEPDLFGYRLHRGASPDFVPGPDNLVVASADTGYVDHDALAPGSSYKLGAVDVHGNVSRFAVVSPNAPTATLASVVRVEVAQDRVRLRWHSAGYGGRTANVHRWTPQTDWRLIGTAAADGSDLIDFEDAGVKAGQRYGYRIGILDGPWEGIAGEVWVDVPGARLALQSIEPNPTGTGDVAITFSLATGAAASLELLDLAGRRVSFRDLSSMGSGPHAIAVPIRRGLAPGVYLVRLRQGADVVSKKIVVVR